MPRHMRSRMSPASDEHASAAATRPATSRKYLVVIDDTEECDRAVYWAAKRAGAHQVADRHAARDRDRTTATSNGSASPTS